MKRGLITAFYLCHAMLAWQGVAAEPRVSGAGVLPYCGIAVGVLEEGSPGGSTNLNGQGLRVLEVDPAGPALEAGLVSADILLRWDEQILFTPGQLRRLVHSLPVGGSHELTLLRDGLELSRTLKLAEAPVADTPERLTKVVRVPYDVWMGGTNWVEQLAGLADLEEPEDLSVNEVSPQVAGVLGQWLEIHRNAPEWMVFLLAESDQTVTNQGQVSFAIPTSQSSVISSVSGAGMTMEAEGGSVELLQRGGRDFYVIRDGQGAVVYEGPMDSELDMLLLRPLPPALRRSVEAVINPSRLPSEPLDVEVWRWRVPPRFF